MTRQLTNRLTFPSGLIGLTILICACSTSKSGQTSGPQPETYLIPENFEGRFRIIYGETCGIDPKTKNGRIILEIPDTRLLIIKPKFIEGKTDYKFFFVDNKGGLRKITELENNEQRLTIRPGVILNMKHGTSAVTVGAMPDGTYSSESPLAIHFTEFTVFNKDTTLLDEISELRAELMAFKKHQSMNQLMNDQVEDCRKKNGR
jgi:hypothetical protein